MVRSIIQWKQVFVTFLAVASVTGGLTAASLLAQETGTVAPATESAPAPAPAPTEAPAPAPAPAAETTQSTESVSPAPAAEQPSTEMHEAATESAASPAPAAPSPEPAPAPSPSPSPAPAPQPSPSPAPSMQISPSPSPAPAGDHGVSAQPADGVTIERAMQAWEQNGRRPVCFRGTAWSGDNRAQCELGGGKYFAPSSQFQPQQGYGQFAPQYGGQYGSPYGSPNRGTGYPMQGGYPQGSPGMKPPFPAGAMKQPQQQPKPAAASTSAAQPTAGTPSPARAATSIDDCPPDDKVCVEMVNAGGEAQWRAQTESFSALHGKDAGRVCFENGAWVPTDGECDAAAMRAEFAEQGLGIDTNESMPTEAEWSAQSAGVEQQGGYGDQGSFNQGSFGQGGFEQHEGAGQAGPYSQMSSGQQGGGQLGQMIKRAIQVVDAFPGGGSARAQLNALLVEYVRGADEGEVQAKVVSIIEGLVASQQSQDHGVGGYGPSPMTSGGQGGSYGPPEQMIAQMKPKIGMMIDLADEVVGRMEQKGIKFDAQRVRADIAEARKTLESGNLMGVMEPMDRVRGVMEPAMMQDPKFAMEIGQMFEQRSREIGMPDMPRDSGPQNYGPPQGGGYGPPQQFHGAPPYGQPQQGNFGGGYGPPPQGNYGNYGPQGGYGPPPGYDGNFQQQPYGGGGYDPSQQYGGGYPNQGSFEQPQQSQQ